jgi:DNA-binding IclR family transcriptional regulator
VGNLEMIIKNYQKKKKRVYGMISIGAKIRMARGKKLYGMISIGARINMANEKNIKRLKMKIKTMNTTKKIMSKTLNLNQLLRF